MATLLAAQRLLWLLALGLWCRQVVVVRRPAGAPVPPRPLVRLAGATGLALGVLLASQLFWSQATTRLASFRRVERYDPRIWRLTGTTDRRQVTDRRGHPLIVSVAIPGGVVRRYPLGPAAAHLTGYLDRRYGRAGLEAACDSQLAIWRQPAWETLREGVQRPPEAGPAPLLTTLDAGLQKAAAKALGDRPGAVVAINPATGDLLALVSTPSFDPNEMTPQGFGQRTADPASPLLNRALNGLYPPGSAFKPLVAAAALAQGFSPATFHETPPEGFLAPYDTRRIKDFSARPHWSGYGPLDLGQALERSANGYFAWLGTVVGADALREVAVRSGLVTAWNLAGNGFDLAASPGRLPPRRLKPGAVARLAIGQDELLVTPLGLTVAYATLANYGQRVMPHLLPLQSPSPAETVLAPEVAAEVMRLLRRTVESPQGTCRGLASLGFPIAAKTGSAQNPHGQAHAWLACFAPAEAATLVVVALVENGGTGSGAALPIARAVLSRAAELGYFEGVSQ